MPNRLAESTSPYLRQHADNPVDWYPWGEEAFAAARRRDVPILLSVGYAACHWCHVMAHDSFERDDVAAVMNAHFVNVKVDREERPDVDAVYMEATTALTGQGGWPMTCLLTPDGKPFFAGTFFPRQHFLQLLDAIAEAWRERREEVLDAGRRIADALAGAGSGVSPRDGLPDEGELDEAVLRLAQQFDPESAGFGRAPKFPPSMVLEFLLRAHERSGQRPPLDMAGATFDAMARGGMYDQLAGGFARYSVDAQWVVPHFEKMLYDNALLVRAYAHWWRVTDSALAERIVRETADFLLRDLGTPEGGFASALDADTDGVEGLTYVWTPQQLGEALEADADFAAELFSVTNSGTFEGGASTLQLRADPADPERYQDVRARLLAMRTTRPQPARDDKVVTAWNGLAIAGLAEAGVLFDEPRYLAAAVRAAELLLDTHLVDGRLRRTSRDGVVGAALAVAEDYGDLAEGVLTLHQASGEPRWLEAAGNLLDDALRLFGDGAGGFFDTGADAEVLVRRPRDPTDNATPSGSSALINALATFSALTGSLEHRAAAEAALRAVAELGVQQPRFLGWGLAAAEALLAGPVQIALVGGSTELRHTAWRHRPPGAVIVAGEPDAPGVPLLADRPLVAGAAAAYVCRGMVCDLPVTTATDLRRQLSR
jgi:uncharacterized protein YyaL (SSP411 family)